MAKQTYADNVDANGKVFKTVGDNIREGARAGELLNFQEITDKIDALEPEISALQAGVAENKTGIKKNVNDISLLNEDLNEIYNCQLKDYNIEWELGDIDKGNEIPSDRLLRTKDYIDIRLLQAIITNELPDKRLYIYYSDQNKQFISNKSVTSTSFLSPYDVKNGAYVRFVIRLEYKDSFSFKCSYPLIDGSFVHITPEMFGAVGDRKNDDTESIRKCLQFASNMSNNTNYSARVKLGKTYMISDSISISNFIYGEISIDGDILYTGNDNAFIITNCNYTNFNFNKIVSSNGNCIKILSESNDSHVSYCTFKFKNLYAKNNCILITVGATDGYVNENTIIGGKFSNGEWGIYVDANGRSEVQFKSYNLGFEGVNNGIYLNGCSYSSIINPRLGEFKNNILLNTVSESYNLLLISTDIILPSMFNLSTTTNMNLIAPIKKNNEGSVLSYYGVVDRGVMKYLDATYSSI